MALPTGFTASDTINSYSFAAPITLHDTNNMSVMCRAIWVGAAGNLTAVMSNGDVVLFSGIAAGTLLPIRAIRVNVTGTTASLPCIALY